MPMSNISYPHPVLGNGDDINNGEVSPEIEYKISDEAIHLKVENLKSGHPDIDQMLVDGTACWHVRTQCPRTYMRQSFLLNSEDQTITLKGDDYEGSVEIEISVVAQGCIKDYQPTGMHSDYGDAKFSLQPGELIAIGPRYPIHVDKIYDPLKAPVSSLVRITYGSHASGPFEVILDDDLITIKLSKADWAEYDGIRDRAPSIVHSSIILPVLAEAIRAIGQNTHTLWGGRLKEMLAKQGIDQNYPLAAAQEVLASPISRTFNEVNLRLDSAEA